MRSAPFALIALVVACTGGTLVPSPSPAPPSGETRPPAAAPTRPAAQVTPSAAATRVAQLMAEADAWARIRAALPAGPVAMPTWLPDQVDRQQVDLRALRAGADPEYEVAYLDRAKSEILRFRLGPVEPMRESGMGLCCVRASPAVLEFATYLFNDPARPGVRRLRWEEQAMTLSVTSERITGVDMLRIGWELDRATAPRVASPDTRAKAGACGSRSSPEDTVRGLLRLFGSRDPQAVLDCFSLDRIATAGPGIAGGADLPTTSGVTARRESEIAGRVLVMATWTFTSDPGGPSGRTPTQFFLLGLEDGAWRIYDSGTAPFGTPP